MYDFVSFLEFSFSYLHSACIHHILWSLSANRNTLREGRPPPRQHISPHMVPDECIMVYVKLHTYISLFLTLVQITLQFNELFLVSLLYYPESAYWRLADNSGAGSSAPVVSRWLWHGNRSFLEVVSIVVSWWIVAFLRCFTLYMYLTFQNSTNRWRQWPGSICVHAWCSCYLATIHFQGMLVSKATLNLINEACCKPCLYTKIDDRCY